MNIAYLRPYFEDPTCAIQKSLLQSYDVNQTVIEEHPSSRNRTGLQHALSTLHSGDTLIVSHLYVLADSTRHLIELLEQLSSRGAFLISVREEIDTRFSLAHSFLEIVQHLVQLQSDVVSMTTRKGLTKAKEQGKHTGRPRKADENVRRAIEMYQSKQYSLSEIREQTGISKSTLYRYLEN
ncbi:resolvase [Exiguobacterium sp. KRL4]|uniref:recombinase family protein n=1 Tax=Exiguobacterium sp. KRL4 TaxID=1914536 RepID=UPI0008F93DB9|nr:recombinase family protein [Exiguobacterium sp. KRL4]OIN65749.1 resolvase [Exiguobacterium sp. KRL4]